MDDDYSPDWQEQHNAERERWETTVGALKRCLKAGAKREDIETLARECGVDIKHVTISRST